MKRLPGFLTRLVDSLYLSPFRKIMPKQMFRYAVCGGVVTVFGWFLYDIVYRIIGGRFFDLGFAVMSPHVATLAIVFPINTLIGFYLQRNIAFSNSPVRYHQQIIRYILSVSGSLVLDYAFLKIFVEVWHIYPTLAQILATLIILGYSFLMQKYFTFRGSKV